jgi:hypothetical protein
MYVVSSSATTGQVRQDITSSGSTTVTLSYTPLGAVMLFWNGSIQAQSEFSVSGTTLTLSFTPTSGDTIQLCYIAT